MGFSLSEFLDKMWIFAPVWFHRFYRNGLDREISNVSINIGNLRYVQYFHQLQTLLVDNAMKFFPDILGHDQKRVKMYVHQPKIRKKINKIFNLKKIYLTSSIFLTISSQLDFITDISCWVKMGIFSNFLWISSIVKSVTVSGLRLRIVNRFLILEAVAEAESVTLVAWFPIFCVFFTYFSPLNFLFYAWQSRPDICSSS